MTLGSEHVEEDLLKQPRVPAGFDYMTSWWGDK